MQIAKVIGTVIATRKDEKLEGTKLLVVQSVNVDGTPKGGSVLCAIDSVGAGPEEIVLVTSGSSARLTEVTNGKPVDAVIVAIVDTIETEGIVRYNKA
ncbi:MAG: EutN/CcmL family microcompartment protein [Oligoflexia bacterium]|nr:EutN/CcmL family microcompartment protein [Oligoflexia bacterium]